MKRTVHKEGRGQLIVGDRSQELSPSIRTVPVHVAIIMDGNGRWAKKRGIPRIKGHLEGAKAVKRIVTACRKTGIKYLTLYAFSTENWKRSRKEINFLFALLGRYIEKEKRDIIKREIRFETIGDISRFPGNIVKKIEALKEETKNLNKMRLTLALNYGARDEIIRAVKKIQRAEIKPQKLTEEKFKNFLDTAGIPDPDIVIRTSGEQRLSNFLLYQSSYSELYFTKTLWPDFNARGLRRAINSCQARKRKFGGY